MKSFMSDNTVNYALERRKRSFNISEYWAGDVPKQAQQILDIFNYPDVYEHFGTAVPKGILLHGLPGTGKTHFARLICTLTESQFFTASASQFDEIFVGRGAQRIRALFDDARKATQHTFTEKLSALLKGETLKQKRAVIFIDELDAIGTRTSVVGMNSACHSTVSQLLTCLDGIEERGNVFVIAATNNLSQVDPALRRSGRFDRVIEMPLPDSASRLELLRFYLGNSPGVETLITSEVLNEYGDKTKGFSAADLKNMANEAVMKAVDLAITRRKSISGNIENFKSYNMPSVEESDLQYAFENVSAKIRKERPFLDTLPKQDKLD